MTYALRGVARSLCAFLAPHLSLAFSLVLQRPSLCACALSKAFSLCVLCVLCLFSLSLSSSLFSSLFSSLLFFCSLVKSPAKSHYDHGRDATTRGGANACGAIGRGRRCRYGARGRKRVGRSHLCCKRRCCKRVGRSHLCCKRRCCKRLVCKRLGRKRLGRKRVGWRRLGWKRVGWRRLGRKRLGSKRLGRKRRGRKRRGKHHRTHGVCCDACAFRARYGEHIHDDISVLVFVSGNGGGHRCSDSADTARSSRGDVHCSGAAARHTRSQRSHRHARRASRH